jgi:hypothetical protein
MPAVRTLPTATQCPRERTLLARDHVERLANRAAVVATECESRRCDPGGERIRKASRELARDRRLIGLGCCRGQLRPNERELESRSGLRFDLCEDREHAIVHGASRLLQRHERHAECGGRPRSEGSRLTARACREQAGLELRGGMPPFIIPHHPIALDPVVLEVVALVGLARLGSERARNGASRRAVVVDALLGRDLAPLWLPRAAASSAAAAKKCGVSASLRACLSNCLADSMSSRPSAACAAATSR